MLDIRIDRNSNIRVYRQIAEQIEKAVEDGVLKPGEKLPTERELSDVLGLARGTINQAFEELKRNNVIKVIPGSGSFVFKKEDIPEANRKGLAVSHIHQLLSTLEDLHFTHGEVRALMDMAISERESHQKKVYIATIDCNPESLAVFKEQFSHFINIEFKMFLLDDIVKYSEPEKVFEDYDIIITTTTHYEQVVGMIPRLRERLFKAAVSPTQETIIQIVKAPKDAKIGMIIRSNNFRDLVITRLNSMNVDTSGIKSAFEDDASGMDKLLLEMDVLIIPHFLLLENPKLARQLHYFKGRGGVAVDFRYQIEKGSLIYIEERVHKLLSGMDVRKTAAGNSGEQVENNMVK